MDNLVANFGGRVDSEYTSKVQSAIKYVPGNILVGNIRPYLKKVWLADREGGASPDVLVITLNEKGKKLVHPRYLYFAIASEEFVRYTMRHAKGAKMPRGDKAATMRYSVPLPPLKYQAKIVEKLDKFDALVNDLTIGLPAEIAARRKQYEHYRDRLLTFTEKTALEEEHRA